MSPSPIQEIKEDLFTQKQIKLFVKRDDLLHPNISGNKWRKLKYNLIRAKELGHTTLLTFGGAYSNHIHAVAAAGQVFDFKTIGMIRGEPTAPLNPTLQFATQQGMQLHYLSRTDYRKKDSITFQQQLQRQFGQFYTIPEGGTNKYALQGCREIVSELDRQLPILPNYICVCCGTGGTISGIIQQTRMPTKVLGFSALKGDFLKSEVAQLLAQDELPVQTNWTIKTNYHFGGYAKFTPQLIDFINQFKCQHQLALDPIYTGKMMYGIIDLIKSDFFQKDSVIVAIHTGGLQGIVGFNQRHGFLIP